VLAFGVLAKAKLSNAVVSGSPEDQLRAPLEALARNLSILSGFPDGVVDMVGERYAYDEGRLIGTCA
jgi:hypothetical protein